MHSSVFAVSVIACIVAAGGCFGEKDPGGWVECYEDVECAATCDSYVTELDSPGFVRTFDGSACTLISFDGGPSDYGCECQTGGGSIPIAANFSDTCVYFGRDRKCIYQRDEFTGCDPENATSCETACADLAGRIAADAMEPVEAALRYAGCYEYRCGCVIRIEDACYVGSSLTPHDCSATDEDILEESRVSPEYPRCSEVDPDAGGGTCIDDGA